MTRRAACLWLALLAATVGVDCRYRPQRVPIPPGGPTPAVRARRQFTTAAMIKPDCAAADAPGCTYAPLIIQETIPDAGWVKPGVASLDAAGEPLVRAGRPTVYFAHTLPADDARALESWVYFWLYPSTAGQGVNYRWLRVTVDEAGQPLLWETLAPDAATAELYVAQSCAGRLGHDDPAALEAWLRAQATPAVPITIVRLLADGPIPMGPMVYQQAAGQAITTAICRCMPSQVDDVTATANYDLVPAEELAAAGHRIAPATLYLPLDPTNLTPLIEALSRPDWLAVLGTSPSTDQP